MPVARVSEPLIRKDWVDAPASVGLFAPVQFTSLILTLFDASPMRVTVSPDPLNEFASKMALSTSNGTPAPPVPPDVSDQWLASL